jgi:hypothetical protein
MTGWPLAKQQSNIHESINSECREDIVPNTPIQASILNNMLQPLDNPAISVKDCTVTLARLALD